ncbi:hypothetical protein M3Y97_01086900 [Aphelenchoides bicaudatus]|nr:hypothetical protein M3Y97_01086900 [Aphelenchoides bicaudatus]
MKTFLALTVLLIVVDAKLTDMIPDGIKQIPDKIKDKLPDSIKQIPDKIKEKIPCAEGKVFMAQGPMCQMTCEKMLDVKSQGINQINPICKLKRPGCFCTDGKILRKKDNSCISKTSCLGSKVLG